MTVRHPAKYSKGILDCVQLMLRGDEKILDPLGGVGGIFQLLDWHPNLDITCIEIEAEWAASDPRTITGDALHLQYPDGYFDAIVVSPPYGNRQADKLSKGKYAGTRIQYADYLGRELSPGNGAALQWGLAYREFATAFVDESLRVLRTGGDFILNMKDHYRNKLVISVSDWYIMLFESRNVHMIQRELVEVKSMRRGRNYESRMPYEYVIRFRK